MDRRHESDGAHQAAYSTRLKWGHSSFGPRPGIFSSMAGACGNLTRSVRTRQPYSALKPTDLAIVGANERRNPLPRTCLWPHTLRRSTWNVTVTRGDYLALDHGGRRTSKGGPCTEPPSTGCTKYGTQLFLSSTSGASGTSGTTLRSVLKAFPPPCSHVCMQMRSA